MNLDIDNWKEFRFGDLVDSVEKARAYNKDDLVEDETLSQQSIRYITRTGINNGCEMLVKREGLDFIEKGNAITIGDTTATCFYQKEDFVAGDHIVVIRASWLNELLGLFIATLLQNEQYKYSYGRAYLIERIKDTIIKLPVKCDTNGDPIRIVSTDVSVSEFVPDWRYMETIIKSLKSKPLTTENKKEVSLSFDVNEWKDFVLENLFDIKRGESLYITDSEKGDVPYASASAENNGISTHLNIKPNRAGNCLSINYDGSVGDSYYHKDPFFASEKIVTATLKGRTMTPCIALFIATIIMKEKYRFSYGRKWTVESSLKKSIIKLPVLHNTDGTPYTDDKQQYSKEGYVPDWEFMEDYIKSLPYGDRI